MIGYAVPIFGKNVFQIHFIGMLQAGRMNGQLIGAQLETHIRIFQNILQVLFKIIIHYYLQI